MRILLIGNGGREHALAWKLAESEKVKKVYCAPGNGGTETGNPKIVNLPELKVENIYAQIVWGQTKRPDLVVIGPEVPLVHGVENRFREIGIPVFGPSQEAAQMEGSKAFSKDFMKRHNIPTAAYENFTDFEKAKEYLNSINHNVVIKASGLAAGKGVIIPANKAEAIAAIKEIMEDKVFGAAGNEVVIEEYLEGDELSILSFCDGYTIKSLPPAQDHKRIFDGDQGPNTGGMGCYAPTKVASKSVLDQVHRTILQPTIDGLRKERLPFRGCLFTGLMMTKDGPKVLEYNVRFGDPETQTVLPLLSKDTDLAEVMMACACGYLDAVDFKVENKFAATVVVAAGGYPGSYKKGDEITIDHASLAEGTHIFHAGTASKDGKIVTAGGRVIAATATADTLEDAVKKAYEGVDKIKFNGMFFRKDIAHRAFRAQPAAAQSLTYADAGVSIDAGNNLVERIKTAVRSTKRSGTDAEIGGFGGVFDLNAAGYVDGPVILGAIDGVGTKLKIAQAIGKHDTVGIDLVAMNVNDLVVQGAEPLFFLDCFSCSKLDLETAAAFVEGVAEGCKQAGCALIGGETAEMPGMYQDEEYDAVGAAVGAVARGTKLLPDFDGMKAGDILLGIASSGIHSNGFSLVRKIVEREGLNYTDAAPWNPALGSIGEVLLKPTRIYTKPLVALAKKKLTKGMSHITGGGLTENVPRMLPSHLQATIEVGTWSVPEEFLWLKQKGGIKGSEFARTWNVGLGMVIVVEEKEVEEVKKVLAEFGETVTVVGKLQERKAEEPGCVLTNLEKWE